jgi:hypothetical protein
MGGYQILIADGDPQSLHEERRNSQLESEKPNLDERVLNMGVTYGTKPKRMVRILYSHFRGISNYSGCPVAICLSF